MINYSITSSFKKLAQDQHYNSEFNSFLTNVNNRMDGGESLDSILLDFQINSWMSRLVIQLISFTVKTGTISQHTLKKLSDLAQTWTTVKKKMIDGTILTLGLAYASPLISMILIMIVPSFSIEEQINSISEYTNFEATQTITSNIVDLNYILLFVIAFFGTILVTKIRTMTIHNSIHAGIIMIVLAMFIYLDQYIGISSLL
jgi:hypothetical protein